MVGRKYVGNVGDDDDDNCIIVRSGWWVPVYFDMMHKFVAGALPCQLVRWYGNQRDGGTGGLTST